MRKSKSRKSSKSSSKSTEREKKIAMHAKAKREAERRRKKGEFCNNKFVLLFCDRDMFVVLIGSDEGCSPLFC